MSNSLRAQPAVPGDSTSRPVWETAVARLRAVLADPRAVLSVAVLLVLAQLCLRGALAARGWYYGDDLKFLSEAATEPLTWEYLTTRHQQQLMPGGLLVSWLVGQAGSFAWAPAAFSLVLGQALASAACLYFLVTLFGLRTRILVPLVVYLVSPITLGAFLWWAAALNQLPMQACGFAAAALYVRWSRRGRPLDAGLLTLTVLVALLFYVKGLVLVLFLAAFGFLVLTRGPARDRARTMLRRDWPLAIGLGVLSGAYGAWYLSTGESPVRAGGRTDWWGTADVQLREVLGPVLLGGPWRWHDPGRPDVLADAPQVAITLAWVLLAFLVVTTCLVQRGAWRGWALLGLYLVPTVTLTAGGRSAQFGAEVGAYVRYLTDVSVPMTLAVGLAVMATLDDPPGGRRRTPEMAQPVPRTMLSWLAGGLMASMVAGSMFSTLTYARHWAEPSAAESYVRIASAALQGYERVEVVDEPVPADLVLEPNAPFDRPTRLLAPLNIDLVAARSGTDLAAFTPSGELGRAAVQPGISATLPRTSCPVRAEGGQDTTVTLDSAVSPDPWWVAVRYVAPDDGTAAIRAGDRWHTMPVVAGAHTYFVKSQGAYDELTISPVDTDLCIDGLEVGSLVAFP